MTAIKDPAFDRYIEKAHAFAQPILRRARELVHASRDDVEEALKWGHPSFLVGGKIICGMAAFKEHCVFGFWHQSVNEEIRGESAAVRAALLDRGCLTRADQLPSAKIVAKYVQRSIEAYAASKPAIKRDTTKKPEPKTPADLVAALKKHKQAAQHWQDFSPSKRREYAEWLESAKKAETRAQRLATALEWIGEGKGRNWKYERC
jgi:uncharacterized protein YdeI (YjbR/CyaY-like superfamily)